MNKTTKTNDCDVIEATTFWSLLIQIYSIEMHMNKYSYCYMNCSCYCDYIFKLFEWWWMMSMCDISVHLFRFVFVVLQIFFRLFFSLFYFMIYITFNMLTNKNVIKWKLNFKKKKRWTTICQHKNFSFKLPAKKWHLTWKTYFFPGNFVLEDIEEIKVIKDGKLS